MNSSGVRLSAGVNVLSVGRSKKKRDDPDTIQKDNKRRGVKRHDRQIKHTNTLIDKTHATLRSVPQHGAKKPQLATDISKK